MILKDATHSGTTRISGSDSKPPQQPEIAPPVAAVADSYVDASARAKKADVVAGLKSLHLLLRSTRLYQRDHPQALQTLDAAYESLRSAAANLGGLEVRFERGGIVAPKLGELPLLDARGDLQILAKEMLRAGIQSAIFAKEFHVGEVDALAQLVKATLLTSEESVKLRTSSWWATQLAEHRVEGISVNTHTERKVDSVLASMIAALVAYGGHSPRESSDSPIQAPGMADLVATLQLLARLTPPLEAARGLSPEEAARAIHGAMGEASRDTVRLLLSSVSQYAPAEGDRPQPYLLRLSEGLIFEFLVAEFSAGTLAPTQVRPSLNRLAEVLVSSGGYAGPHASAHLSSFATTWATDIHRENLVERFWLQLPAREKSAVLRGPEIWCIPVAALRQTLTQLSETGADAQRREARAILLNYVRRLEDEESILRRVVSAGLHELAPVIESLWPNQLPDALSRVTLQALVKERSPESAALQSAFLEMLARVDLHRGDYAGFESILHGVEKAPQDQEHLTALARRLVSPDRWLLLVDGALRGRALDPVLPRLLQRDPEKLVERLSQILIEPRGPELISNMARLLRTIGGSTLNSLETRLYDTRRQRVSTAIKLLAAADPDRLLRGVSRALASWEWNLQDLAVSELARPANAASAQSSASVFSAVLADAHPFVVPMMIDQIGLAQETTSIPQLMEIAAGEHEILRDQFVRTKAIEALGRMRAQEASEMLRQLVEQRDGLVHVEPSGLRAAAEDALAMIEERPSSARVRATFEAATQSSANFVVPRRYIRVPLDSPLRAHIDDSSTGMARVKTISLGGAYLQSQRKLNIGDSIQLQVRSGLRKINFTAVVRNIGPEGSGVEFVHMKDKDREILRKLVHSKL